MTARSPDQLRGLSEHVLYEVQMLFAMADHLRDHVKGNVTLPWPVLTAFIESFAVHTRVLYEFLWHDPSAKPNPKSTHDGFASEYFPPGDWAKIRDNVQKKKLEGLWARTGSEIVHLSYKRIALSQEAKVWEFDVVAGVYGMAFRLFLKNVDPQLVAPDFEQRMRASWPEYLNYPVAISFPPDTNAHSVASTTLQDMSQVRVAKFEDLLP